MCGPCWIWNTAAGQWRIPLKLNRTNTRGGRVYYYELIMIETTALSHAREPKFQYMSSMFKGRNRQDYVSLFSSTGASCKRMLRPGLPGLLADRGNPVYFLDFGASAHFEGMRPRHNIFGMILKGGRRVWGSLSKDPISIYIRAQDF